MNPAIHETDRHLTNEQFVTLLLSSGAGHPHLRSCELCASQLEGLRSSIGDLRDASVIAAERHYRAAVRDRAVRQRTPHRPRFAWAITALAGVLFIGAPFAAKFGTFRSPAHPPVAVATVTPPANAASNLSDDQLLNNIDSDLSASVPSPLLPLESTSTTASTKETE